MKSEKNVQKSPQRVPKPVDSQMISSLVKRFPSMLLLLGIFFTFSAHMRWGISWMAWIAPVPYLRYLRLTKGGRSRLLFWLAFLLGWTLAVLKITTSPLSLAAAPMFGVPIGSFLGLGYLGWDWFRSRTPRVLSVLVFPSLMVLFEWLQHMFTPFGSWGAAAYTQLDQLALLQVSSLVGMAGVSFLIYWVAALLEDCWSDDGLKWGSHMTIALTFCLLVWSWGGIRLATGEAQDIQTIRIAAVSTDATFGSDSIPSEKALQALNELLFTRTKEAALAGARLVVWNEGSTMVWPKAETKFKRRLQELALHVKVFLVAAYIVPVNKKPMLYENKYLWIDPQGNILQTYLKHKPVFGEPAIPGKAPSKVISTSLGKLAGAICYDYDSPRVALSHAIGDAGLVVLPSSDWLGIHPYHTQMAAVRAIEGGFSILRSTRLGLSAGIDAYGRIRGRQSWFEQTGRVMLVDLPAHSTQTIYASIGDLFVLLCACFTTYILGKVLFQG